MSASRVIAVTGLKTEARLLAGLGVLALSGGGDAEGLSRVLESSAGRRTAAIISYGVAGGLAPGLPPGTKLVARAVIDETGARYPSDAAWSARLSAALGGAKEGDIAGVNSPVAHYADKYALHLKTGALAADMESHVAARVAAAYGLPFAAFRVIADPAHRQLPHAAMIAIRPDGSLAIGAILASLLRDPAQIPQLMRTARDARVAFMALFRSRKLLAGALAVSDFREFLLDVPAEDVFGGPLRV
ncbi:MAG TPA: phosphorylase [Methylocella sp.]|nr:phosphorylase [Methylocella sp.]